MTAVTRGFRSRAQLGLEAPRSVSYNITPAAGGVAAHWEGPHMGLTAATNHKVCEEKWRGIQAYHKNRLGWADVAYTGAFCQHGYAFAGRGFGVRTAANGTNTANAAYYAFCFIGGTDDKPTVAALNALEWWVRQARLHGKAGLRVRPHSDVFPTACPGPDLKAKARSLDNRNVPAPYVPPVVVPPTKVTLTVRGWQTLLKFDPTRRDGIWGPATEERSRWLTTAARIKAGRLEGSKDSTIRLVQRVVGTPDDGDWGSASRTAMTAWTRKVQANLGVPLSGNWDAVTAAAYARFRTANYK